MNSKMYSQFHRTFRRMLAGIFVSRDTCRGNYFQLKRYGERDFFQKGWHFRVFWLHKNVQHFAIGFHETNPFIAILKTKFVE